MASPGSIALQGNRFVNCRRIGAMRYCARSCAATRMRDLMGFYFQGAEGWAIVGYDEFPGHVRHDQEPCEVIKIIDDEDGRVLLELSDATIEELDPSGLVADKEFVLTAAVKSGRLRAGFARSAYYQLAERIDMQDEHIDDRFVSKDARDQQSLSRGRR